MKKLLTIVLALISVQGFAQTVITGINISLPQNPDALTANWGVGTSPFIIRATAQTAAGRVGTAVEASKILVIIKKDGSKVCGAYTSSSAPAAEFNAPTKVWSGNNAVSLLGKDCALPPGDYELSVQFFGDGAAGVVPLSDEKTKPFTIKGNDQQTYQAPQAIAPADGTSLNNEDIKKPITFRWTPVIPRPQGPVTYRLKVWQLMQGQTGPQAIKANQPIIIKDVDNLTQAVITNLITGPCKPPYLCDFIWNVQALNRDGKTIGENSGFSETSQFTASACDVNLILNVNDIECLSTVNGSSKYKVCVSATYNSSTYNLTYANAGSGFKAYAPSFSPVYPITNLSPVLQVQSAGSTTTVQYCFEVSVPTGQTDIQVGLQGDDKDPGPIVCQAGAVLNIKLPVCKTCDCGSWNPLNVQTATRPLSFKCGSSIQWHCNTPFKFSTAYQCNGAANQKCPSKISWNINQTGGGSIATGGGSGSTSGGFTPTTNGTYTLTLDADCNGKKCEPCVYTITVNDCKTCGCGQWGLLKIPQLAHLMPGYTCGTAITWNCNKAFSFTSSYQCDPNDKSCQAKITWDIKQPGGGSVMTGGGSGSTSGNFTPTANGTYTLTLNAICNGKKCDPCVYTITVNDCKTCDCGTWGSFNIPHSNGLVLEYKCGNTIQWAINQPFNFSDSYKCSPNDGTCRSDINWDIKKDGVSVKTGTGTGGISGAFTPTESGTYTITLYASCNGKQCAPCVIYVKISDDPCPQLCNGGFEQIINGQAPSDFVQTDQANVPCWKTTASDHLIEIWHTGFNSVAAYSGNYFAEINGTMTSALYQTFTIGSSHTVIISFAHRGRYSGYDKMKVSLIPSAGSAFVLGTYSASNSGWVSHTTSPHILVAGTYMLKFESISTNDGKGPADGGNFLDDVKITCTQGLPAGQKR